MAGDDFHEKAFDEGTLTKLEIFQLYTREWLPVFLSREHAWLRSVHLYDFFAGPGADADGVHGSPLRTLKVLREYSTDSNATTWGKVPITVHFFDAAAKKIATLERTLQAASWKLPGVEIDVARLNFREALAAHDDALLARDTAKLLLIDQFGVSQVTPEVFRKLVAFPCADFLFFVSSATLQRFREHPAIKQKITPAADFNQVHHAVVEYYRQLLPAGRRYYLAPFSIKKGSNIYGLVFGSAHPLGMDKFLRVAWEKDRLNGTANFDINRDSLDPAEGMLPLGQIVQPRKVNVFEEALENLLRQKRLRNELEVIEVCFAHGVTRQHASPVLKRLKQEGVVDLDFATPAVESQYLRSPRAIRYA